MKVLLVTEKCGPTETQRDGGARVVKTLQKIFKDSLSIMQFGPRADPGATWHFEYPFNLPNRFKRRLANSNFIAEKIKAVEQNFTHIIFIHVSMQFGLVNFPLQKKIKIWTFPMFLTPSYRAGGENVPEPYFDMERLTLASSENILTPSRLEKQQLIEIYSVLKERIHVVPRGVDTKFLTPRIRALNGPPKFCSVGSIKSQKNILGLIHLFMKIRAHFEGATLRIIGPVQDVQYYKKVCKEIRSLKLENAIEFFGYVPPEELALAIEGLHIHISTSTCETFGRTIFETLASGLPNVAKLTGNAAAEFLEDLPYARFIDDETEAVNIIKEMLANLSKLSSMALEVGNLYDEEMLSQLLAAKLFNREFIAVSDFDGTLFHKEDPQKTQRCITAFAQFPNRVICSARPIKDLLNFLDYYNLKVDWILGFSGATIANGHGEIYHTIPLDLEDIAILENLIPNARRIEVNDKVVQIAAPIELIPNLNLFGLRIEKYLETAFIANWEASKLRAVHRLLRYLNWTGQVCVFGDGPYDNELIAYFDGVFINSSSTFYNCQKEI